MENLTETKLTSEKIYSGCILDFYRDTVRLPNGGTAPRELTRHVGAVCIVPLLDDGRVIVERQFRYPVNEVITEIPAGKRDSRDEAPDDAARRELREETGYALRADLGAAALDPLPQAGFSSTGLTDETVQVVFAQVERVADAQPEPSELIEPFLLPIADVPRFLAENDTPIGTRAQLVLEAFARRR